MSNQEPTNQDLAGDEVVQEEISSVPNLPKIIRFDSLARCGEEVWIENNGQIYRLRKTKQGKLILTK
ncbi:MAG: hemin uptake protein HemP [Mariniblastus sp.]|jgi:hemin uptake protein HemP|nr:hemin uptake protein HemP [Planctomycetaceae bacterium]MDA7918278.1 hemin uptake protein HemP [Mariniblastus sp.]MDB4652480.1 hemin uptake protein HemP [bacterium]MCP4477546.1 hemin uptake protein HemP [Planctomycetaceae bacterium]MDA7932943.1 hemin uptake protein HemP [Mariniblastus sp.]